MPGRIVGETVDGRGRRGFVLTLATREQHIRRERATSNICTNQGLCTLAVTVYLSMLGRNGLARLARSNYRAAHDVAARLEAGGVGLRFGGPFFNEVVVQRAGRGGALAGAGRRSGGWWRAIRSARWYPELRDALLICVTEVHGPEQVDRAGVRSLSRVAARRKGAA